MKLAIMQPYLFPYIGYFQLIHAVDTFVLLDDVNFIKKGWINRNRILLQGRPFTFTVPLVDRSSNRKIDETEIAPTNWQDRMVTTIAQGYRRAPGYAAVMPLVEGVLRCGAKTIDELAYRGLRAVAEYLEIDTRFVRSTRCYGNQHLKGRDRVLDICARAGAATYINASGGRELYRPEAFAARGIELRFIRTDPHPYPQPAAGFVPNLSIIDVLMQNSRAEAIALLGRYDIEP